MLLMGPNPRIINVGGCRGATKSWNLLGTWTGWTGRWARLLIAFSCGLHSNWEHARVIGLGGPSNQLLSWAVTVQEFTLVLTSAAHHWRTMDSFHFEPRKKKVRFAVWRPWIHECHEDTKCNMCSSPSCSNQRSNLNFLSTNSPNPLPIARAGHRWLAQCEWNRLQLPGAVAATKMRQTQVWSVHKITILSLGVWKPLNSWILSL